MARKTQTVQTNETADDLQTLAERLDAGSDAARPKDAIDQVNAATPRSTAAVSLRDHEIVQRFRRELTDGLIRVDTARQLLGLIRMAVEAALK